MHKNLKREKGVTLISLVVTIVVMMILVISITSSLSTSTELKRFNEVKEDIVTLTEEVKVYYLNNGTLPIDTSTKIALNISSDMKNVNDGGNYYPIKIDLLDVELNNGEGNKQKNYTTTDLYVVDDVSLTVYYVNGITINGITYYTLTDDFVAGNYYKKTDLPIVASVTMQSNRSNKNKATLGDKVTLRIITNYELTQTPTVKINNTEVTVTWNGTIGTASYTISADSGLSAGDKIAVNISGQQADGRVEGAITDVTFGKGVYIVDNMIDGVIIPDGFYYVGGTRKWGLVISDEKEDENKYSGATSVGTDLAGNQFVWIPVDDIKDYKRVASGSQVATGEIDTETNSEKINSSSSNTGYFTEKLPDDEKNSVDMYKGFYLGRYEAGDKESTESKNYRDKNSSTTNTVKIKRGQAPYNYVTLAQAQELVKSFKIKHGNELNFKLPSSYAWDAMMTFIPKNEGISYTEWGLMPGNFYNTSVGYIDFSGNKAGKMPSISRLVTTGCSSVIKNIYDIAGNVEEMTTEKYSDTSKIVSRGDSYLGISSGSSSANSRAYISDSANSSNGFRIALFL